jgi:hypothetical protein
MHKVSPLFKNLNEMVPYMFMGMFGFTEPRETTLGNKDAGIQSYMRNSEEARAFDPGRILIFDV